MGIKQAVGHITASSQHPESSGIRNRNKSLRSRHDFMEVDETVGSLHEAVFNGDLAQLATLLPRRDVAEKDRHGNTALHLAAMLGRRDCIQLLLANGAPVLAKNLADWSALTEAISYGDRPTVLSMFQVQNEQEGRMLRERKIKLVAALSEMEDFYMEVKWEFQSWVPFVSRMLPSDVCRVHKKGSNIRVDTTLVDFKNMRWQRGDLSFVFRGDGEGNSLNMLDNKLRIFIKLHLNRSAAQVDQEVDLLMSTETMSTRISTAPIAFTRLRNGWLFKEDRTVTVGAYNAEVYDVRGVEVEVRVRSEHMTPEDLQNRTAMAESLLRGGMPLLRNVHGEIIHRPSLPPPPATTVTWSTYINSDVGKHPVIGRQPVIKKHTKAFKAGVSMSRDFPLTVDKLLSVLAAIASVERFATLRDFVQLKLPPGFPVRIDIPLVPALGANVTFQEFAFRNDIGEENFLVPEGYVEMTRLS